MRTIEIDAPMEPGFYKSHDGKSTFWVCGCRTTRLLEDGDAGTLACDTCPDILAVLSADEQGLLHRTPEDDAVWRGYAGELADACHRAYVELMAIGDRDARMVTRDVVLKLAGEVHRVSEASA